MWPRAEGSRIFPIRLRPRDVERYRESIRLDLWALNKDGRRESTLAHDEDLFLLWTSSDLYRQRVEAASQIFRYLDGPRFKAIRTEVRDLRIHLSRSGDVAWYYRHTLDDVVEFDGKRGGMRISAGPGGSRKTGREVGHRPDARILAPTGFREKHEEDDR